jgi:hypothetical protein
MNVHLVCDDPEVTVELRYFVLQAQGGEPVSIVKPTGVHQGEWQVRGDVNLGDNALKSFVGYRTELSAAVDLAVELSRALPNVGRAHESVGRAQETLRQTALALQRRLDGDDG